MATNCARTVYVFWRHNIKDPYQYQKIIHFVWCHNIKDPYEFQKMMLEDKANTAILNLDSWLAETFNKLNIIAMNNNDR